MIGVRLRRLVVHLAKLANTLAVIGVPLAQAQLDQQPRPEVGHVVGQNVDQLAYGVSVPFQFSLQFRDNLLCLL